VSTVQGSSKYLPHIGNKIFALITGFYFYFFSKDMDVAELQNEINRLTRELDQAHTEKVQSATYGLSLLEEKQALTKRYEELENLYENVRQELDITQEVILFIA
jgi:Skp family chaperone for outer membrane proteins